MISPFVIEAKKALLLIKRITHKIEICLGCGYEFVPRHTNSSDYYCSPLCRVKGKTYEYTCHICSKTYTRPSLTKSKHTFCSPQCKWIHQRAEAKKNNKKPRPNWGSL